MGNQNILRYLTKKTLRHFVYSTIGALCSNSALCVPAQPTSDPISQDVRDTLRASFPSVEIFFFGSLQVCNMIYGSRPSWHKVQLYPTDFESNRGGRIYQWWCPRMGVAWQAPWVLSCWHCAPQLIRRCRWHPEIGKQTQCLVTLWLW